MPTLFVPSPICKPLLYTSRIEITLFPNTTLGIGIGYGCVSTIIAIVGVSNSVVTRRNILGYIVCCAIRCRREIAFFFARR
jgi:hypothetical protein